VRIGTHCPASASSDRGATGTARTTSFCDAGRMYWNHVALHRERKQLDRKLRLACQLSRLSFGYQSDRGARALRCENDVPQLDRMVKTGSKFITRIIFLRVDGVDQPDGDFRASRQFLQNLRAEFPMLPTQQTNDEALAESGFCQMDDRVGC
jgi:hypothetical protein